MVDSTVSYERCIEAAGIALAGGDRATAERALRAAIQSVEGLEGSQLESALVRLGTLKQEMGSHAEAEDLFRKALDFRERALGPDDLGLVPALTGLGTARILRGSPEEAEPVLARALAISESHLGEDHPDLVILLNDLTRLYLKQSAYAFAEPLLLRLLAMKRSKGEDHPEVATVLASLAAVRQALGRHEAAEQLWRRVLSIRERTLAPNHFALATAAEHLAETCAARGKISEALQLFQRALAIREATLGIGHSSLRVSRERIADLQLQASEDSLDSGDASALAPAKLRLPMGESLGMTVAATPGREKSAVVHETESALLFELEPSTGQRMAEKGALPAPAKAVMSDAERTQAEAVPYFNVLRAIKDELEDTTEHQARGGRAAAIFAAAGAFLQERRAAAIIVAGAITLPLVALAVAGAARSGQSSGWAEQTAVAEVGPRRDSGATASPPLSFTRPLMATSNLPPRSLVTDERSSGRRASENAALAGSISIPTAPQPLRGLDSVVRAISAPVRTLGESSPVQLASSLDSTLRLGTADLESVSTTLRARLIGAAPNPRYPAMLLSGRVGGEVRVRFNVDTTGRPVMSTFSVVASPDAWFTAAVRKVIPGMRFEPARLAGPDSRAIVDMLEMAFQFSPPPR